MNPQDQTTQPQPTPTQPVAPAQAPQPVQATPQPPQLGIVNSNPTQAEPKKLEVKFEDDLILYVTSDTVDDMRFLELYDTVSENNMKLPKLLRFMFGDKEFESIYAYYESKGQRFSMTKMEAVFEKFNTDMNSNPDFLRR